MTHLHQAPRLVSGIESASRRVPLGQRRGGLGSHCLMGTEFQFCKMKKGLELDGTSSTLHPH